MIDTPSRDATETWNTACQQRGLPLRLVLLDGGEWGVMSAEDSILLLPTGTATVPEAIARAEAFARGLDLGLKAGRTRADVAHRRDLARAEADADALSRQIEELESIIDEGEQLRAAADEAEAQAAESARIEADKMEKLRHERDIAERMERERLDRERAERENREAERRLRDAEDRAIQEAARKAREAEMLEARIAAQTQLAEQALANARAEAAAAQQAQARAATPPQPAPTAARSPAVPPARPTLADNLLTNISPPLASFIPALAGITPADHRPAPLPAPIEEEPLSLDIPAPGQRFNLRLPTPDPEALRDHDHAAELAADEDYYSEGTADADLDYAQEEQYAPAEDYADDAAQDDDYLEDDQAILDDYVPAQEVVPLNAGQYTLPAVELLTLPQAEREQIVDDEQLDQNAELLGNVLQDFNIKGEIVDVCPGPVVTLYEFEPAPGLKSSRIIGLADDIARSMSSIAVRIAVVPGRTVIGIELPNEQREMVYLGEMLRSPAYVASEAKLPLVLGKDIAGEPIIADLAKMPHLLIAGTTGSGKSVGINAMILSLLYRHSPRDCRLIMIDPKMLELSVYDGIPHLLTPVVTDPKKAVVALKWAVKEMEDRYRAMAQLGVRNIEGYNSRVAEMEATGERPTRRVPVGVDRATGQPIFEEQPIDLTHLPYIVVVVDEMADLMLVAGKEIEACIQRLAQMARAAGIHIVMATQRPSVDVITGTIKANFPTRISFQVTSKIDSRTILGDAGAEQLLGQGDMLFMVGGGRLTRVHGPFVSDSEVEHVVTFLKAQGVPDYIEGITREEGEDDDGELGLTGGSGDGPVDELFDQAVAIIIEERKVSTSFIQRKLQIGYNRAARLVEQMEEEGIISAPNHVGKREILARLRDF
ncbi:DNA translocase FtsK [Lacibacterium aquatile]|uniref:DNA translocase FtsK n=1 Tax=Lacibacterium aquatile TaxID=1168082 RepID=A0ABW5DVD9_9PROT